MSFFSLMTNICNKVTCEKVKSPGKCDTHSFLKMSFKITSVNKGLRTSKKLCQTKRWKRLCCNTKLVIEHLARVIPHSKQNYYPQKKKKTWKFGRSETKHGRRWINSVRMPCWRKTYRHYRETKLVTTVRCVQSPKQDNLSCTANGNTLTVRDWNAAWFCVVAIWSLFLVLFKILSLKEDGIHLKASFLSPIRRLFFFSSSFFVMVRFCRTTCCCKPSQTASSPVNMSFPVRACRSIGDGI